MGQFILVCAIVVLAIWVLIKMARSSTGCNQNCNQGRNCNCGPNKKEQTIEWKK